MAGCTHMWAHIPHHTCVSRCKIVRMCVCMWRNMAEGHCYSCRKGLGCPHMLSGDHAYGKLELFKEDFKTGPQLL